MICPKETYLALLPHGRFLFLKTLVPVPVREAMGRYPSADVRKAEVPVGMSLDRSLPFTHLMSAATFTLNLAWGCSLW